MRKLLNKLFVKYFKWKNVIYKPDQFTKRFDDFVSDLNRLSGGICLDYMREKKLSVDDLEREMNNSEFLLLLTVQIPDQLRKKLLEKDVVCRGVRILDIKPKLVESGSKLSWTFLINLYEGTVIYNTFIDLNQLEKIRKKYEPKNKNLKLIKNENRNN